MHCCHIAIIVVTVVGMFIVTWQQIGMHFSCDNIVLCLFVKFAPSLLADKPKWQQLQFFALMKTSIARCCLLLAEEFNSNSFLRIESIMHCESSACHNLSLLLKKKMILTHKQFLLCCVVLEVGDCGCHFLSFLHLSYDKILVDLINPNNWKKNNEKNCQCHCWHCCCHCWFCFCHRRRQLWAMALLLIVQFAMVAC